MITDYNTLKVPELKKLLQERSLPVSGNKAELISRLTENDKASAAKPAAALPPADDDEIDWDDEEAPEPAPTAPATNSTQPAPTPVVVTPKNPVAQIPSSLSEKAVEKAANPPKPVAEASLATAPDAKAPIVASTNDGKPTDTPAKAQEAAIEADKAPQVFTSGIETTTPEEELKKLRARSERWNLGETEAIKNLERAVKFGTALPGHAAEVAGKGVKGLDEALPERRPKRGREANDTGNERAGKRHQENRRAGAAGARKQGGRNDARRPERKTYEAARSSERRNAGSKQKKPLLDAEEQRKAEARARRFAVAA